MPSGPDDAREFPLETWRSRAELPASIAALVPADVDFAREMLAGTLRDRFRGIELRQPTAAPARDHDRLILDERARVQCPICSGAAMPTLPAPTAESMPVILWRLPRRDGVTTVLRMRPARPCPPCMAP